MKLKAVIIEDELNAQKELKYLLNETGEVEILISCDNALDGIKAINSLHPDVVFLDIQLPVIDGLEMLSMIEESLVPRVVFVTAYDEYALKAFENDAVDYLLKPVERERLIKTIERLKKLIQSESPQKLNLKPLSRIPSTVCNKVKLVDIDLIEYVHSDGSGIFFFDSEKKYFTELTLKVLEEKTNLFRCHKQYLINLDKIDEVLFEENSAAKIQTKNKHYIPVSRHYLKALKEHLGI